MRLNVGVLRAKELFRPVNRQLLDLVRVFAAAVIALPWISFGVFVREDGAHCLEHRFRDEVFRWDQLQPGRLALRFFAEQLGNLRVHRFKGPLHPFVRFRSHWRCPVNSVVNYLTPPSHSARFNGGVVAASSTAFMNLFDSGAA